MPEIPYQRLTRSHARGVFAVAFQSRVSLWLGPDHLLCVDSSGYSEHYKRFYFRDIQAITIRKTTRRNVWNGVLALPAVVCTVGLAANLFPVKNVMVIVAWSIFAALFIVPLGINNLLGPTCASQLRTAVQIEELPPLCRVRRTRRVVKKIRPLIAAAQGGEVPAEVVSARMWDWAASAGEAPAVHAPADAPEAPPGLDS